MLDLRPVRRVSATAPLAALFALACGGDSGTHVRADTDDVEDGSGFPETGAGEGTGTGETSADARGELDPDAPSEGDGGLEVNTSPSLVCDDDPGAFGCACQEHEDCNSSFCLPTAAGGKACTKYCTTDCPDGFDCSLIQFPGSDPTFLCLEIGLDLCRPCTSDAQCQSGALASTADRCVRGQGRAGSFCGIACSGDDDFCPDGYVCETVVALEGGAETEQCVPTSDTCTCSGRAIEADAWTTCSDRACTGSRTCTATGLSACDAPPYADEVCDGRDNDCDAATDEGAPDIDQDGAADCVDDDDDNDGVPDDADNCPLRANPDQADNDLDDAGDDCDDDDDGDAVLDAVDVCPLVADPDQADSDEDGRGDACDDDTPEPPLLEGIEPRSPSSDPTPIVRGQAERGARVTLYADAHCEGLPIGGAIADAQGAFSADAAVPVNATSTLHGTATDGAGHVSACSEQPLVYTHDDIAADVPVLVSTDPSSPSRTSLTPTVAGTAETGTTVRIYVGLCAGTPLGDVVAQAGAFSFRATAMRNALTSFVADAVDLAGNTSACSDALGFVHDDVAPAAPALTHTTPASPSNASTRPTLSGLAESGANIAIYGKPMCGGPVLTSARAADGAFTAPVEAAANGTTTYSATATDLAGNTSPCSAGLPYTHDTQVPDPPVITASSPPSPSRTSVNPRLEGTANNGTIRLYANDACAAPALTTAAATNGAFSASVTATRNATSTFSATLTDASGNTSACSTPFAYLHDDIAPGTPTLTATDPASPSAAIRVPLVHGSVPSADAGATVTLYGRAGCLGDPLTSGLAGPDGTFVLAGTAAPDSTTSFSARATDPAGNTSGCSGALEYVHDAQPPAPPVFTGTDPTSPSATITSPTLVGTAEVASSVAIYASASCAGPPVANIDAPDGHFMIAAAAVANGATQFTATATDAAGLTSPCSLPITYVHDNTAPAAPTFTGSTPASPSSQSVAPLLSGTTEADTTVALFASSSCAGGALASGLAVGGAFQLVGQLPANSTRTFYAHATDAAGNTSPCSAGLSYTHDNIAPPAPVLSGTTPDSPTRATSTPFLDGSAEAGVTIQVFTSACGGTPIAIEIDNPGPFSIQVDAAHNRTTTFYANATDAAGNVSGCSNGQVFVHDDDAPAPPVLARFSPAAISHASASPTLEGTVEQGATLRVYPSADCSGALMQSLVGSPATFALALTLSPNATSRVSATATDLAGNTSTCSNSLSFTHDDVAPDAPTITASSPSSPSRVDMSPALSGSAEPGATVRIYTNGGCTSGIAATTVADASGFTAQVAALANGTRTFFATATDLAGNTSDCSAGFAYTHDDTRPSAPTWTGSAPPSPSRTVTGPRLLGNAEAGASVAIFAGNACGGAALIVTNATGGAFGGAVDAAPNHTSVFTATATDAAGNVSECSAALSYTHDSTAPAAPRLTSTSPPSPSNTSINAVINGDGEPLATIRLFTNPACSEPQVGVDAAAHPQTGAFAIAVTVAANSATTFYAKAIDAAGNPSDCSTGIEYLHDNLASDTPIITGSNPGSPNRLSTSPTLLGTAEAGATVRLYKDRDCLGSSAGSGITTPAGSFEIASTAASNATTLFYARATDAANNLSTCSGGFAYTHDTIKPGRPTLTGSSPDSPATSTTPTIAGDAEPASTVRLFTDAGCTTQHGAATTAGISGQFDIAATVGPDALTRFYATATDAAGNTSDCSDPLAYVSDNSAPSPPTWTGTTPGSPSNGSTSPTLSGAAEVGATIHMYASANCAGPAIATVPTLAITSFSRQVNALANHANSFSATASDAAGNLSDCSEPLVYVHDDIKPPTPVLTATTPDSPSATVTAPSVVGTTAETGVTIDLFANGACTGLPVGTIGDATSTFAIPATVATNSTTSFTVKSRDPAGNPSGCSNPWVYRHDSLAPGTPSITLSNPLSPSGLSTTPELAGNAEAGSRVDIFAQPDCTGARSGSGTAVAGNVFFGIAVSANANAITTYYAKATDDAGNASECSPGFAYEHDNQGPTGLVLAGFDPGTPSVEVATKVVGTIDEAGLTIRLFKSADCSEPMAAQKLAAPTVFSIGVTANANATTWFSAKAFDIAGNPSACSNALAFLHDNITPTKPVITGTDPTSPSKLSTTPKVLGTTAEADLTVRIYTSAACLEPFIASGTADPAAPGGAFSISAPAVANGATTFYAKAFDAAANASACSNGWTFAHDDQPPPTPILTGFTPGSPSTTNSNTTVNGTETDLTARIMLYPSTACTGTPIHPDGTPVSSVGQFNIGFVASTLGCTPISARAVDPAGNTSGCSSALTFAHYGCPQCPCAASDWVRQFGTSAAEIGYFSAVHQPSGSVYIAGSTYGPVLGQAAQGGADAYLAKYGSNGALIWARQIGTSAYDVATTVVVDDAGDVYIGGGTEGDIDASGTPVQVCAPVSGAATCPDVWVAKYASNGTWQWTSRLPGARRDIASEAKWDSANGRLIVGVQSTNVQAGSGMSPQVLAVNATTGAISILWSYMSDVQNKSVSGMAVDGSGNIYLQGRCQTSIPGALTTNGLGGGGLIYLYKLSSAGAQTWLQHWGSPGHDIAYGLTLDASGNIFTVGFMQGVPSGPGATGGPYRGANGTGFSGWGDGAVARFDAAGTQQWVRIFGTPVDDSVISVGLYGGQIHVAGYTRGNMVLGTSQSVNGGVDIFTASFNLDGSVPTSNVRQFGTAGDDTIGRGVLTTTGTWYLPGTSSADWTGMSRDSCTHQGGTDAFLARFCASSSGGPPVE